MSNNFGRELAKDAIRTAVNTTVGTVVGFAVGRLLESLFGQPGNEVIGQSTQTAAATINVFFGTPYRMWGIIIGALLGFLSSWRRIE